MIRTKDDAQTLVDLTGETGAALLDDVTAAVDDLAAQGIVAKDADPVSEPNDVAPAATETVDLDAMKQTIDRMKEQSSAGDAAESAADAEIVALRNALAVASAEIIALRDAFGVMQTELATLRAEQQLIASKDADSATTLAAQVALLNDHNAKSDAVVAGLFDLVLGVSVGSKEIVIERDGNGSVHDPEGVALAKQMGKLGANGTVKPGEYAGATLFGS